MILKKAGNYAVIFGNGESRKENDMDLLWGDKSDGLLIGCNAIYRDNIILDRIVAIDPKMIEEISNTEYKKILYVPPVEKQFEHAEYRTPRRRQNAGMVAMEYAITDFGMNELYCLGFDSFIQDYDVCMSNVYTGTIGYGDDTMATYNDVMARIEFFKWFAKKYSNVNFNFVYPASYQNKIFRLKGIDNVKVLLVNG